VLLSSLLVFAMLTTITGDSLDRLLRDNPDYTYDDYTRLRNLSGFDDPVYVRYVKWASSIGSGQVGYSRLSKIPVTNVVTPRPVHWQFGWPPFSGG
jgi:peptide/nickel transport system permease protein